MPNMDGLEATRLIRKAGYTGPIVALSAYSDDTNIKVCMMRSIYFFSANLYIAALSRSWHGRLRFKTHTAPSSKTCSEDVLSSRIRQGTHPSASLCIHYNCPPLNRNDLTEERSYSGRRACRGRGISNVLTSHTSTFITMIPLLSFCQHK